MKIPFLETVKKGKGPFLYTLGGDKYFDLRNNTNILGFSPPKLTTAVKNGLSNSWNIKGVQTVYHKRLVKLIEGLWGDTYTLRAANSPVEFWSRLSSFSGHESFTALGAGFCGWLDEQKIRFSDKGTIVVEDKTESFLYGKPLEYPGGPGPYRISGANYYWYPHINPPITGEESFIMLPELFSGLFNYCLILVKKELTDLIELTQAVTDFPSLYICSSLKLYYLIKKYDSKTRYSQEKDEDKKQRINWKGFLFKGRLFSYAGPDRKTIEKKAGLFAEKKILLTRRPPYYNYIPVNLEEYHYKYLNKVKDI